MQNLEFHLARVWPELDVSLSSVTDQWAAIAIAGPRDGEARIGSTMLAANPLMGEETAVTVVSPHMYDPENQRVRS